MKGTYIIGITGGSASGKSTFSRQLREALQEWKVKELHMDSYFKAEQDRGIATAPITGKEYRDDNHPSSFDLPGLKRNMTWGLTFDQIADVYLDMVRYRHEEFVEPTKWRADFILNGSNPSPKVIEMIVAYIKAMYKDN